MMLESWSSRDLRPRKLHDFKLETSFFPFKFPQILEMLTIFQMAQVTITPGGKLLKIKEELLETWKHWEYLGFSMRFNGEDILEGNLMAMDNHLISIIFGFGTQIVGFHSEKLGDTWWRMADNDWSWWIFKQPFDLNSQKGACKTIVWEPSKMDLSWWTQMVTSFFGNKKTRETIWGEYGSSVFICRVSGVSHDAIMVDSVASWGYGEQLHIT